MVEKILSLRKSNFILLWLHFSSFGFVLNQGIGAIGSSEVNPLIITPFKDETVALTCGTGLDIVYENNITWFYVHLALPIYFVAIKNGTVETKYDGTGIYNFTGATLEISNVSENDSWTYLCTDHVHPRYFIQLIVKDYPAFVDVNDVTATLWTTAEFVCTVENPDKFLINWEYPYNYNWPIWPSNYSISHEKKNRNRARSSLKIFQAMDIHERYYSCSVFAQSPTITFNLKTNIHLSMQGYTIYKVGSVLVGELNSDKTIACTGIEITETSDYSPLYLDADATVGTWYRLIWEGDSLVKIKLEASDSKFQLHANERNYLTIKNVELDDESTYICIIGNVTYRYLFHVRDPDYDSKFGVSDSEIEIMEGKTLELKCKPGQHQLFQIRWMIVNSSVSVIGSPYDFTPISKQKNFTVRYDNHTFRPLSVLTIPEINLLMGDRVCINCTHSSEVVDDNGRVCINILKKPRFTFTSRSLVVKNANELVYFDCFIENLQNFELIWERNPLNGSIYETELVPKTERFQEETDYSIGKFRLTIRNITLSDQRFYYCRLKSDPPIIHLMYLKFSEDERKNSKAPNVEFLTANISQQLNLTCSLGSHVLQIYNKDQLLIQWFENNEFGNWQLAQINELRYLTLVHGYSVSWDNEANTLTLIMHSLHMEHTGLYTCKIFAPIVEDSIMYTYVESQFIHLTVNDPRKILDAIVEENISLYETMPLKLSCYASNREVEMINWFKYNIAYDGYERIYPQTSGNERYNVALNGQISALTIDKASLGDGLVYRCSIYDFVDRFAPKINVTVVEAPEIQADDNFIFANINENLNLTCTFRWNSALTRSFVIKWSKKERDGYSSPIQENDRYKTYQCDDTAILQLTKIDVGSENWYYCSLHLGEIEPGFHRLQFADAIYLSVSRPGETINIPPEVYLKNIYTDLNTGNLVVEFKPKSDSSKPQFDPSNVKFYTVQIKYENNEVFNYISNPSGVREVDDNYIAFLLDVNLDENIKLRVLAITNDPIGENQDKDFGNFPKGQLPKRSLIAGVNYEIIHPLRAKI